MDQSGGSEHSHSHSRDINGNWHCQHLEIIPELSDGSGTSSMHSETLHRVGNGSGSINQFDIKPKDIEGSVRTYPFETIPEVADRNERVSSSEDLCQVDTEHSNFGSLNCPSEDEEIIVSTKKSTDSRASDTSICSNFTTQFSQVYGMPPTQSPPRQVMDRSGEYDPLRISSAVFERSKSSTPQEWSGTSTESLFSIQIGINSFSTDRIKSGELTKSDELIMFTPSTTSTEVGADKEGDVFEKSDETPKGSTAAKNQKKAPPENVLRNPSGMSTYSEESSHSFAFPVKKKKKKMKKRCCTFGCVPLFCCRKKCKRKKCAWPSCYCSNCSCTFCYCSWPSCYFRWPSCYRSNCSWAFCYCWNCSLKRWCCHSSTTLTDKVKSPTGRPDVEEKKEKKPLAKEPGTPKSSSSCCWFSCFFCRPRSCCPWSCSCPSFRCSSCCCSCPSFRRPSCRPCSCSSPSFRCSSCCPCSCSCPSFRCSSCCPLSCSCPSFRCSSCCPCSCPSLRCSSCRPWSCSCPSFRCSSCRPCSCTCPSVRRSLCYCW